MGNMGDEVAWEMSHFMPCLPDMAPGLGLHIISIDLWPVVITE